MSDWKWGLKKGKLHITICTVICKWNIKEFQTDSNLIVYKQSATDFSEGAPTCDVYRNIKCFWQSYTAH